MRRKTNTIFVFDHVEPFSKLSKQSVLALSFRIKAAYEVVQKKFKFCVLTGFSSNS